MAEQWHTFVEPVSGGQKAAQKIIKVFNLAAAKTEAEKRAEFDQRKLSSGEPAWIWNTWKTILFGPKRMIEPSNIISIQVKNLLNHAVPITEGNPHIKVDKPDSVWLQYDRYIRVIDLTSREYRMPRDENFRVAGLELWWRHTGGARVHTGFFRNMLELGLSVKELETEVSLWHGGNFTATTLAPLPFLPDHKIMIGQKTKLDTYVHEINRATRWYLMHESMLYTPREKSRYVEPLVASWTAAPTRDRAALLIQPLVDIKFTAATLVNDMRQIDFLDNWQIMKILPPTAARSQALVAQLETRREASNRAREHLYKSQTITMNKTMRDHFASELHPGAIFASLPDKEKALVEKKISHRAVKRENPELRKLVAKIHRAFNAAITDTFEMRRVADLVKKSQVEICPHYHFIIAETLRAHKNTLGQIDTESVTQACVKKHAGQTSINFRYYCATCSELLMQEDIDEYITFNQSIVSATQDKDPIWAYILSECNQVVRRIRFAKPQNTKTFVLALAQTLEPEMLAQKTELQQSKTKSIEDVRATIIVIINVYCFALVSKMIIDHPAKLRWNVVAAGAMQQVEAARVLNLAYNMILDTNQNRISNIKDFSSDNIKPILLKAYTWARNAKFMTVETAETVATEWTTTMTNDPWYNLIYEMAASHGRVAYTDFKKLFGEADPLQALCSAQPFAKAFRPKPLSPREENYLMLLDYVDSGAFREFVIPKSPVIIAWWKKYQHLLEVDDMAGWERQLRPTRGRTYASQSPTIEKIDVSMVRCDTGELHDFSIFVFKGKKTTKISLADIKRTGRAPEGKLDDEICSRCGRSKYARADPKVRGKIAEVTDRDNFFRYFVNRCPAADDIHDFPLDKSGFIGDEACKKCRYQPSFAETRPVKWWQMWNSVKIASTRVPVSIVPDRKLWTPAKTMRDKWNVTLASVMQLANTSGIPYNIWINLGLSEHTNFNLLKQNKLNPQSTIDESAAKARLVKLVNWVRWVHRQYMLVRNHARVVVPMALKAVLEAETHLGTKTTLEARMPDILRDFNATLAHTTQTQTARIACNYVLHTLCNTLLQIRALAAKKLGYRLFDYLVAQIVQGETLMSELEIAKLQTAHVADYEDTVEFDEDTYTEAQEEKDVLDRGTEDPFSMNDVDISNANMGGDDDEDYTDYS